MGKDTFLWTITCAQNQIIVNKEEVCHSEPMLSSTVLKVPMVDDSRTKRFLIDTIINFSLENGAENDYRVCICLHNSNNLFVKHPDILLLQGDGISNNSSETNIPKHDLNLHANIELTQEQVSLDTWMRSRITTSNNAEFARRSKSYSATKQDFYNSIVTSYSYTATEYEDYVAQEFNMKNAVDRTVSCFLFLNTV